MRNRAEPRKLHESLPMVRGDSRIELCKATDEDGEPSDKLEVTHGKHRLAGSVPLGRHLSRMTYISERIFNAHALLTPSLNAPCFFVWTKSLAQ